MATWLVTREELTNDQVSAIEARPDSTGSASEDLVRARPLSSSIELDTFPTPIVSRQVVSSSSFLTTPSSNTSVRRWTCSNSRRSVYLPLITGAQSFTRLELSGAFHGTSIPSGRTTALYGRPCTVIFHPPRRTRPMNSFW